MHLFRLFLHQLLEAEVRPPCCSRGSERRRRENADIPGGLGRRSTGSVFLDGADQPCLCSSHVFLGVKETAADVRRATCTGSLISHNVLCASAVNMHLFFPPFFPVHSLFSFSDFFPFLYFFSPVFSFFFNKRDKRGKKIRIFTPRPSPT